MYQWTYFVKRIRHQHCLNKGGKQVIFWTKTFSGNQLQSTTKETLRIWFSHLIVWQYFINHIKLQIKIFLGFQLKLNEGNWTSLIRSGRYRTSFVFCCYKRITVASSVQKKLNESSIAYCVTFYWLLCKFHVHWSASSLKLQCFINMINMSYCGKSHWNGVKLSPLTKF